ncbi:MAG: hypothetical protein WB816_16000 [Methylocystis sp.]
MKLKMNVAMARDRWSVKKNEIIDADKLTVVDDKTGNILVPGDEIGRKWIEAGLASEAKPEEEAVETIDGLMVALRQVTAERDGHRAAVTEMQAKLEAANGRVSGAEGERDAYKDAITEHANARAAAEARSGDLEKLARALQARAADLEGGHAAKLDQLGDEHARALSDRQAEIDQLKAQLADKAKPAKVEAAKVDPAKAEPAKAPGA